MIEISEKEYESYVTISYAFEVVRNVLKLQDEGDLSPKRVNQLINDVFIGIKREQLPQVAKTIHSILKSYDFTPTFEVEQN